VLGILEQMALVVDIECETVGQANYEDRHKLQVESKLI
jgi:hypothetical protein